MRENDVVKNTKKFNLNRPITGVIQKDRIWEQWYDPEKMKTDLPMRKSVIRITQMMLF